MNSHIFAKEYGNISVQYLHLIYAVLFLKGAYLSFAEVNQVLGIFNINS